MQWYWIVLILLLIVILCVAIIKLIAVLTRGKCNSTKQLNGKVVLITGGSKGIGYQTALNLARRGAKVIITGSNLTDLQAAHKKLIKESGNEKIVAKQLNLNSLTGVREFARSIIETEPKLDILINNAGTSASDKQFTEDGIKPVLQINYIAPFVLTTLLLDLLIKSSPSRVVNVGSMMANISLFFDSNNINRDKFFKIKNVQELIEYINSKICMLSGTIDMANRLKGTGVSINYVHPGIVYTNMFRQRGWTAFLGYFSNFILMKTPEQASQTTIHAALCEKTEGVTGAYFIDCKPSTMSVDLSAPVCDRIWEQTIALSGLKSEEMLPVLRRKKADASYITINM